MRSRLLFLGIASFLVACTSSDHKPAGPVCGNQIIEAGEQCDGAALGVQTCEERGFHSGELSCASDCRIDTGACNEIDADGDGLSYDGELAQGTHPEEFDTDGDGLGDGFEVDLESDPLDWYSWPTEIWPNRNRAATEAGVSGRHWVEGLVPPNISFLDQFGDAVSLYQFYGYVVVLSIGGMWCPPCQQSASTSEVLWQSYRAEGVIFLEIFVDGPQVGVVPTREDLESWASQFDITYPVLRPPNEDLEVESLPTYFLLDRELTIATVIEGYPGNLTLSDEIELLTN